MSKPNPNHKIHIAVIANIVGVIFLALLYMNLNDHQGYSFLLRTLQANYESISENRKATLSQRYAMKLRSGYLVYARLAANTPPDAVIYLPGKSALEADKNGANFHGNTFTKGWALRFLYPRKVVLESEYDTSIYTPQITHVAIVNGVGAEKLPYKLSSVPAFGVLPIDPALLQSVPTTSN